MTSLDAFPSAAAYPTKVQLSGPEFVEYYQIATCISESTYKHVAIMSVLKKNVNVCSYMIVVI